MRQEENGLWLLAYSRLQDARIGTVLCRCDIGLDSINLPHVRILSRCGKTMDEVSEVGVKAPKFESRVESFNNSLIYQI